ncbi:DUF4163 domain-containing protein [Novosphingobium sp. NBM11]|jgi:hypothetical protein|uniref:DUF4163 domain-containing protein n=1 Tax=Novosphingobium sp. NBM11 TaxID=2596914 RepID=UPI0021044A4F|nr:DUF4163 domain-containing protein [Novosphingobium sp. NBM11]
MKHPVAVSITTLSIAPVLFGAMLATGACSKPAPATQPGAEASSSHALTAPPAPPAPPQPMPAVARKVSENNDLYEFDYAYPAAAGAIPALRDQLDKDLIEKKQGLVKEASDDRKEAKANDYPFHAHSLSLDWKVVTDLPGWLSLSTIVGSYSGGAHPNYVYDTVLWDKAAGQRRGVADLFTSKAALSQAIRQPFCAELNRQRAKKRGEPVPANSDSEFDACIDPVGETVILGSAGKQGFDRIGVLVAPYDAGPYAEGSYEVTVPVTSAVLAAVKPEYRAAFKTR